MRISFFTSGTLVPVSPRMLFPMHLAVELTEAASTAAMCLCNYFSKCLRKLRSWFLKQEKGHRPETTRYAECAENVIMSKVTAQSDQVYDVPESTKQGSGSNAVMCFSLGTRRQHTPRSFSGVSLDGLMGEEETNATLP